MASRADLGRTATTSVFSIDRPESIPTDGSWHRVLIAVHELDTQIELVVVPRTRPAAYLQARCVNTTDAPLLPGPVHMFTGGDYVGVARLADHTPPGGTVTLGFGKHDRFEVEHELVAEHRKQKRSKTRVRYHYRTRVRNYDSIEHRIVLLDQVPVATDSRIKVRVREITPPPGNGKPDEKGGIRWELTLAAGAEQTLDIEYDIEFPKDWQLSTR